MLWKVLKVLKFDTPKEFKLSSGGKVTDINFLSECKELQKLQLDISDGYGYGSQDEKINDITILKNLKNLEVKY